jgi:quinoprotein glucose dehydrogenase
MHIHPSGILCWLLLSTLESILSAQSSNPPAAEWPSYGGTAANLKYSALDQINRSNLKQLKVAWRWKSIDEVTKLEANVRPWLFEVTPLMVGGTLYISTGLGQIAAIEASSGKTLWTHDPKTYKTAKPPIYGFTHRGVAYWPGAPGFAPRILMGTVNGYLLALDAKSGQPVDGFGTNGTVDLGSGWSGNTMRDTYTVTSAPMIIRDVVVVGSGLNDASGPTETTPPGNVRGYDVRTGKMLWDFHSVPREQEFGYDTWLEGSAKGKRGVSAWAPFSGDEALGHVYLPFSTPSNDYYGGNRPGDNLFGTSIVCLDATTGKRVWHFQTTHHDIWDYDPPAAPTLVDITVDGRRVRALAQVTKQGFVFVLDRANGKPVWPIVETKVPQSATGKERTSLTQPVPTRPAPFDRQGATENDVIDFTPALRTQALEILRKYNFGPLFTPPSFRGSISLPGAQGGASWAGAAFDPESQTLFVPSITRPTVVTIYEKDHPRFSGRNITTDGFRGFRVALVGPQGLPLFKPPFGRITAIDLKSGKHRWVTASGVGPVDHPALKGLKLPPLGWPLRTFVLATKSLLFAAQEGPVGPERFIDAHIEADHTVRDSKLRAYDKQTGTELASFDLPSNATGSPMTYFANGKQIIVVAIGGSNLPAELVAFSLP